MAEKTRLEVRELDRKEIEAILRRNQIGRIAFSLHDRVSIEPINYVYDRDDSKQWIYGRTSPGVKLATIRHNYKVAFEVDEAEGLYAWRSVIVHGSIVVLVPSDPGWDREAWRRGVELLRRLDPDILTEADPVPERDIVFRIAVQEATGRAAAPVRETS